MSRDPFPGIPTVPASQHGYSYSHNNPVNLTDPTGEFVGPAIAVAVGIGFVVVAVGITVIVFNNLNHGASLTSPSFSINLPHVAGPLAACMLTVATIGPVQKQQNRTEVFEDFVNGNPRFSPHQELIDLAPDGLLNPEDNRSGKVIVELGAGTYDNAIAQKLAHPSSHVIATNSFDDWELGRLLYQQGKSAANYYQVGFYEGWETAQKYGVDVGIPRPYENTDVGNGIADLVFTILPYPSTAFQFGRDAARIAKQQSGTRVAITAASKEVAEWFEEGFKLSRPTARFIKYPGALFGSPGGYAPGQTWELGPSNTWIYEVP